nr:Rpn family recombination-promoting nuclease/putative transposase [Saprospiraceae bacterium]
MEEFLPSDLLNHLVLKSLNVLKESYLDNDLKEYFSDLVIEIPLKDRKKEKVNVALLFEHKSSPDRHVLMQVGFYIFSHWMKLIRQKKKPQLIIPLIYYQGKKHWKVPQLTQLFDDHPIDLLNLVPRVPHLFIALNEIPDHQIDGLRGSLLAAAMAAQRLRFKPLNLVEEIDRILALFPLGDTDQNFLEMLLVYSITTSNISQKKLIKSIEKIPQPNKDNIMNTYQTILEKERQEGRQEGINEIIIGLYEDGIPLQRIAKVSKLSVDK